jgi:hypothetical protein
MKNILRNTILIAFAMLLFATVNTKSQGLSFELVSVDDLVNVDPGQTAPKAYAVIKNIAGESKSIKVKIGKSDMHPDHVVGYCWGLCYQPSVEDIDSPDPITLEPGASSGEEDCHNYSCNSESDIRNGYAELHDSCSSRKRSFEYL